MGKSNRRRNNNKPPKSTNPPKPNNPSNKPPDPVEEKDEVVASAGPKYTNVKPPASMHKNNAFKEICMLWEVPEPPTYGELVAKALHKPQQFFGWQPKEYGFHWTDRYTTDELKAYRARKRQENSNFFPLWSVNKDPDCSDNAFLYSETRVEYESMTKNYQKSNIKNAFDGDTPTQCPLFATWGPDLAIGLWFLRNYKFEHPDKSNQECWDDVIKVLQSKECEGKADLYNYWSKHIKTKKFKQALKDMERIKDINSNLEAKLPIMRKVMLDLGLNVGVDDRKNFERLQKWAVGVPTTDQSTRRKTKFVIDLVLGELPAEETKRLEKKQKADEKEQKKEQKLLDKKVKLHKRPDEPQDGDIYFNDDGIMVLFTDGNEDVQGDDDAWELPYIPCCQRKASMCSIPENPQEGDLFYDDVGNLVQWDVFRDDDGKITDSDYHIVSENDVIDTSKIIGKAPAKKLQPPRKKTPAPVDDTTVAPAPKRTRTQYTKKKGDYTFWDETIQRIVIDVDKVGDISIEDEELKEKQTNLKQEIETTAHGFERQLKKTKKVVKVGKNNRGYDCFECDDEEWKKFYNWAVDTIMMILNSLSSNYGVKFKKGSWSKKHERAMTCAKKMGIIPETSSQIVSRQDLERWFESWMSDLNCECFYGRLAALEEWIGPNTNGTDAQKIKYASVKLAIDSLGLSETERESILTIFLNIIDA